MNEKCEYCQLIDSAARLIQGKHSHNLHWYCKTCGNNWGFNEVAQPKEQIMGEITEHVQRSNARAAKKENETECGWCKAPDDAICTCAQRHADYFNECKNMEMPTEVSAYIAGLKVRLDNVENPGFPKKMLCNFHAAKVARELDARKKAAVDGCAYCKIDA